MHSAAIIGTGSIGRVHAEAFHKDSRCRIAALCSRTTSKCDEIISDLMPEEKERITITDDWHSLLSRSDIDIVSIALPPALHKDVTIAFLKSGKHVLLEKPMALTLEEEDEIIEAEKESGKKLGIIFQNRYYSNIQRAKKMLSDGYFGKILSVDVTSHWFRGANYHNLYWRGTWESEGGGCLTSQGVHQVDMLLWFMGGLPESITAIMDNRTHTNSETEDEGMAFMRFPGKALGSLTFSLSDMDEFQGFRFQCEKAAFTIPSWSLSVKKPQPNGYPEDDEEERERLQRIFDSIPLQEKEGHDRAVSSFIDAVDNDTAPDATSLDGRNATEFIDAFYLSAATEKRVSFPLGKDSPVYTKEGLVSTMPRFFSKTISTESQKGRMTLGSASRK